jgi:hypothetical protein
MSLGENMDGLEFASIVIKALVWPGVAMYLLVTQKDEVSKLIERINKVKVGAAEASFNEATAGVLNKTAKLVASDVEPPKQLEPADVVPLAMQIENHTGLVPVNTWRKAISEKERDERLRASGLIMEEWNDVEESLNELARLHGVGTSSNLTNVTQLLGRLLSAKVISEQTSAVIQDLRRLRNEVAHSKFEPSREAAENYEASCIQVLTRISEEEAAWQEEVQRILGPEGVKE